MRESSSDLASSVTFTPMVFGAMSLVTRSNRPGWSSRMRSRASGASRSSTAVFTQGFPSCRISTMSTPTATPCGPTTSASTWRNPPGAAPRSSTDPPFPSSFCLRRISSILKAERARNPCSLAFWKKRSLGS